VPCSERLFSEFPSAMAVLHIVLIKLKANVEAKAVEAFGAAGKAMIGKVPGVVGAYAGPPILSGRTQGFDYSAVIVLSDKKYLAGYKDHPDHVIANEKRLAVAQEENGTLAYDLEYDDESTQL